MKVRRKRTKTATIPVHVAVLIPSQDTWVAGFGYDLATCMAHTAGWLLPRGGDISINMIQSSLLPSSRMELVKRAVKIEATHLMWFDSDMRFPKDTILRLLERNQAMVGANYVYRGIPPKPVSFKNLDWNVRGAEAKERCYTREDSTGLEEVESLGFGCVLMRREVVAAVSPPGFEVTYDPKVTNGWTGEDVHFCRQVKAAGYPIYVDHDLSKEVGHMGMFRYTHAMVHLPESPILTPEEALTDGSSLIIP
jgi:hypothetical protein